MEVYLLGDSKSSQTDKKDVKCDQHAPPSYGVFLVSLPCNVYQGQVISFLTLSSCSSCCLSVHKLTGLTLFLE